MEIKEWIKAARLHKEWTQERLGVAVGRTKANVGHWESGKHEPKFDLLVEIAQATGFPPPVLSLPSRLAEASHGPRQFPVLSHTQAASLADGGALPKLGKILDTEFGKYGPSPRAFFLALEGDAMAPEFREGDRVLVDPEVRPQPGDCVVASNAKRQALLRKYRVRGVVDEGAEVFELVPLNADHAVLRSDKHRLTLIGTVLGHRRMLAAQ